LNNPFNSSVIEDRVAHDISTIQAFKLVNGTQAGKDVIAHLVKKYLNDELYAGIVDNNQLALGFDAGRRSVVQFILNTVNCNVKEEQSKLEALYGRLSTGPSENFNQ